MGGGLEAERNNDGRGAGRCEKAWASVFVGVGRDGAVLRSFGACAYAAALKLKVAQAAFSERARQGACAAVRCVRALQVRVVASARACAGSCARSAFGPPRQRRRRRLGRRGGGAGGGRRGGRKRCGSWRSERLRRGGDSVARGIGVDCAVYAGRNIGGSRSLSRWKAGESGATQHFFWQ